MALQSECYSPHFPSPPDVAKTYYIFGVVSYRFAVGAIWPSYVNWDVVQKFTIQFDSNSNTTYIGYPEASSSLSGYNIFRSRTDGDYYSYYSLTPTGSIFYSFGSVSSPYGHYRANLKTMPSDSLTNALFILRDRGSSPARLIYVSSAQLLSAIRDKNTSAGMSSTWSTLMVTDCTTTSTYVRVSYRPLTISFTNGYATGVSYGTVRNWDIPKQTKNFTPATDGLSTGVCMASGIGVGTSSIYLSSGITVNFQYGRANSTGSGCASSVPCVQECAFN